MATSTVAPQTDKFGGVPLTPPPAQPDKFGGVPMVTSTINFPAPFSYIDTEGKPVFQQPPGVPPAPIPPELQSPEQQEAAGSVSTGDVYGGGPIWRNPRTGAQYRQPTAATANVPIIDWPISGPQQAMSGVERIAGAKPPQSAPDFFKNTASDVLWGLSDIYRGGLKTITPAFVPYAIENPGAFATSYGIFTGTQELVERTAKYFGLPEGYQRALGDLAGTYGGTRVYRWMSTLGKVNSMPEANAINERIGPIMEKLNDPTLDPATRSALRAQAAGLLEGLRTAEGRRWLLFPPLVKTNLTDVAQGTRDYLLKQGIRLPLSFVTGSEPAATLEASVQRAPGGGAFGKKMQAAKEMLTGQVAPREVARISPEPVTPEQAGRAVSQRLASDLEAQRQTLAAQASPQQVTPEEAGTAVSQRLASHLEDTRSGLAQQVHPEPMTPEGAGQSVIDRGKEAVGALQEQANASYDRAWQDAGSPRLGKEVPIGRDATGGLVMGRVQMPVDIRWMKEIARAELPKLEFLPAADQAQSALVAIYRRILAGGDYITAEQAEEALKGFKAEAGYGKNVERRTASQGAAANIIPRLQRSIDAAVAEAGPEAVEALRDGRAITAQKHAILDVYSGLGRKDLSELEPVGVFNRLIWGKDAGINQLRAIAQYAPEQMPQLGRAFIDSGGDWNQLGPETRNILFKDPNLIKKLDNYYQQQQQFGSLTGMEPVGLFNRLTQGGGAKINLLRDVAEIAPRQMPGLARAFIDSGGDWTKLDPQTKNVLFGRNQRLIADLDKYYEGHAKFSGLTELEPVALFNRLTESMGQRLNLLRDVAKQAPEQMPALGRAFVQGLLDRSTREGDILKVQSTLDQWLDLDPESKKLLINDPGLVKDLDGLFFGLKKLAQNPNPSGSGFMMALAELKGKIFSGLGLMGGGVLGYGTHGAPGAAFGAGAGLIAGAVGEIGANAALSRLLFNRPFVKLLSEGIKYDLRGDSPRAALIARTLAKMAEEPPQEPPGAGGPPAGGGGPAPPPPPAGAPGRTPFREGTPFILRDFWGSEEGSQRISGGGPAAPQPGGGGAASAAPINPRNPPLVEGFEQPGSIARNALSETFDQAPGWRQKLNARSDLAQQRIDQFWKDQGSTLGMSRLPVDILAEYAILGARKIVDGAEKFSDWSKAMLQEKGDAIKPYLAANGPIWREAQHLAGMIGWGESGKEEMPLGNRLTVPAGPVDESAPKIVVPQENPLARVQSNLDSLDAWHKRNPNIFANIRDYIRGMNELFQFKSQRVPIPPENLIAYGIDGPALGASIDEVSPSQRRLAEDGLKASLQTRQLYASGIMKPIHSALYFAWGALSPRQSPYPQEAGFLHALDNGIERWIQMSSEGKFTEENIPEYREWAAATVKGTPGAQATSNLNAFGERFLINAGLPVEHGPYKGMRTMDALHQIIGDPDLSAVEARRRYQQINNTLGLDNKVFSFVLLVTGHHDTLVADRVRINDFWNAPTLKAQGLAYTTTEEGMRRATENLYDNGMSDFWDGIKGLGMYEQSEKLLADRVRKAYADRGIADGTLGRWHWETWVAKSAQEVSHGSLGAVPKVAQGMTGPQAAIGESVRQGKFNDLSYGVRYEKTPQGYRYNWLLSDGTEVPLTREQNTQLLETLREMKTKKNVQSYTGERVIQKGIKTSEAEDAPWRELPGVNKEALDRAIKFFANK